MRGLQITVLWEKKEHHLLGYFPDATWQRTYSKRMLALQQGYCRSPHPCPRYAQICEPYPARRVKEVKDSREHRNNRLVAFLNEVSGLRLQQPVADTLAPCR